MKASTRIKTIEFKVSALLVIGLMLAFWGVASSLSNLDWAQKKILDPAMASNMGIISLVLLVLGLCLSFYGIMMWVTRRSDVMTNKFVNIMDVFTTLVKKQLEIIDTTESKKGIAEIDEKGKMFAEELKGIKRI